MFETDPLLSAIIYNCWKGKNRHEHTTYMSKSARPKKMCVSGNRLIGELNRQPWMNAR